MQILAIKQFLFINYEKMQILKSCSIFTSNVNCLMQDNSMYLKLNSNDCLFDGTQYCRNRIDSNNSKIDLLALSF